MDLGSRRKHHFMIVFLSLLGSNFSSCCPALSAANKASCQDFGMVSLRGGLGQGTEEGSGSPLLPSESEPILHCCLSLSPLTFPGLVQDPPVPLCCPTGTWIQRYHRQLARSISPQFLEDIIRHLRRLELLTAEEAAQVQAASPLPEQVRAVVDVLAGKGSHASQSLQSFIQTSNSQLYLHITVYEPMVQKHLESLQSSCGNGLETGALQRLTNLLLVEGLTDIQQKEHDILQVETTKGLPNVSKSIPLEKLFLPLSKVSIPPRISVTIGVAGIGKSTLVKLFVCSWAKGEINRDIMFVLPLTFRELNTYEKLSAERLICSAFPHIPEPGCIAAGAARTLLILDGLDEFKTPLDFSNAAVCTDPKKEIQVDNLITNIIRGNLLQEASVWVTSRPAAARQIPSGLVDRMTEIRGFGAAEMKGFLDQMFLDNRDLSSQVLQHIRANRSLHVLCTIPGFCWISGSSIAYFLKHSSDQSQETTVVPRTLSEIYSYYFKMALSGDWLEKPREALRIEQAVNTSKKLVGSLGRLAFYGLLRKKHVFYEQDMKAYGIDLSLLHSSLSTRLLLKEDMQASTAYYFSHLTIQEFLAALYYYTAAKRAIFDLFTESGVSWPKLGFLTHFRSAVQRALQAEDRQLDIFVRFLSGLLSPQVNRLLCGWLLLKDEHGGFRSQAISVLQGCLNADQAVSSRAVNAMRCLHEIQHTDIAQAVEEAMRSGSLAGMLTPTNCSALAYLLQVSDVCLEETNLSNCLTYNVCKSLLSQLLFCHNLRLDNNQFKDDVMELLGSVLSVKDCQIQRLSLAENQISNKGAKALARSLLVNRSLMVLDLRSNSIGPTGAKALADALKKNQILLSLNLQHNSIKEDGATFLAEALLTNHRLMTLHLQKNAIGAQGARKIAEALKQNCSLRELILSSNSVGDNGSIALAEALRVNHSLQSLDLRENSISKEGGPAIARALRSNSTLRKLDLAANLLYDEGGKAIALAIKENRALTSLHLQWNFIQAKAATALAQALQSNSSLASLDLQENAIGDEGMAALSAALKVNSTLADLHLQVASVGAAGAQALAEALMVNKSLQILDLRGNSLGLAGAKAMAQALRVNRSLRRLNLQENSLGMEGAICIATALKGNHGLTYVNLQGNCIGQSGAKMISDAIRTNVPDCVVDV
ncbi:NLR family CARD domain-containing protein 3 isoform X2 [Catharus ustulatus]|uniref:NLR family CARD domain-containing protein 3 isoform X2 n=1 Tax=Catharus ustulatus TaxID=91951 RepID=UPI00140BB98E|nr:NLR family CARD domain-containing protein 3 isoform X2 [Catharus ustulatus]